MRACLCLLGVLMATGAAAATASELSQAKQALAAGQPQVAADMLRRQIQATPADYEAWFLLGVAETRDRRYQRAIEAFRHVIELRPQLAEPHNNLAYIYNDLGDVPAAVEELEASLKKRPGYAMAEENLGNLHLKLALHYYRSALRQGQNPQLAARYERLLRVRDPLAAQQPGEEPAALQAEWAIPDGEESVIAAIEAWRQAWQAGDAAAYFACYAGDYRPGAGFASREVWRAQRRHALASQGDVQLNISGLSLVRDSGRMPGRELMLAEFDQDYVSADLHRSSHKRLYLSRDTVDGAWRIWAEEETPHE